jgi:hypothetical protein
MQNYREKKKRLRSALWLGIFDAGKERSGRHILMREEGTVKDL